MFATTRVEVLEVHNARGHGQYDTHGAGTGVEADVEAAGVGIY
ncbi:hypothetical protein ACQKB4_16890 [Mycobacterium tuberculosis]